MAARLRVHELAKELNLTNKALLDRIAKMPESEAAVKDKVRSHMSSLEKDEVETIRKFVLGKSENEEEVSRVRSTVIRRRKKKDEVSAEAGEETPAVEATSEEAAPEAEPAARAPEAKAEVPETEPEKPAPAKEKKAAARKKEKPSSGAKVIFRPPAEEPPPAPASEPEQAPEPEAPAPVVTEAPKETVPPAPAPEPEPVEEPEAKKVEKSEPVKENEEKKAPEEAPKKASDDKAAAAKKKKKTTAAKIIKRIDPEMLQQIQAERNHKNGGGGSDRNGDRRGGRPARHTNDAPQRPVHDPAMQPAAAAPGSEDPRGKRKREFRNSDAPPGGDRDNRSRKKGRKRSVVEGDALYGGRGKKGKKGKRGGASQSTPAQKTQITVPKAIKRRIKVDDTIVLAELAKRMGLKANLMIQTLMGMGVMATVNQTIDYDTAVLVASEFGFEVERASFEEEVVLKLHEDKPEEMVTRAPVVTVMGHVDHGKTSLLDTIRKTKVVTGEAGGITQHIGAYSVKTDGGKITFLDTPGHEAFTAMRSRGAQVTDIVILVVAADDGVMPQTVEAINHAKAAEVPIIVAVNKIDKPEADPDRVKRELSEYGILSEDWGGEAIFVHVSAKEATGIDELLEMVLLQAEVLDLKANPNKLAVGHVVEAKLDTGRGPVATILIQEGTLKAGDAVVCGIHHGRVRAMLDDQGKQAKEAGPAIPVEVLGLGGVPAAGDELFAVKDEKDAKSVSGNRAMKQRAKELAKSSRMSLDKLFEQMAEGEVKELNLIVKADVQGSIEAIKDSLDKLSTAEVKINVIHSATGTVSESDISLAAVSNAIILGFNVRPGAKVHDLAKEEHVDMRFYDVIYNALKDIQDAMVGLMDSTFQENVLGRAEVRDTFVIPKVGTIAGCFVTDGTIHRNQKVRLLRDGVIMFDGALSSLKRFKDDVREVVKGYECGMGIERYNDIKVGDVIECYDMIEIKPTLG